MARRPMNPTEKILSGPRGSYTKSSAKRKKDFEVPLENHHIIPIECTEHIVFQTSQFHVNSMSNRTLLPTREYTTETSRGIRTRAVHYRWTREHAEYNRMVAEQLDQIRDNFPEPYWHEELRKLMFHLRHALRDGLITLA